MTALSIFIGIAFGGCAFLCFFLYALWREEYEKSKRTRVEITKVRSQRTERGKLLRLYPAQEVTERKSF